MMADYLYSPFIDFALNSNDGSMIIKFANSFGQSLSPYSSVLFDSTGLVWFQSIELPSTDTGALWFDIVFEGNLRWLTLTGFTIPTTIGFISGYDVYFATTFQSSSDLCLMRARYLLFKTFIALPQIIFYGSRSHFDQRRVHDLYKIVKLLLTQVKTQFTRLLCMEQLGQ